MPQGYECFWNWSPTARSPNSGALRSHATAWHPDQFPTGAAPISSAMRMASPVLKRLPRPGRGEAQALFPHPQRGREALPDQDLGEVGVAAVFGDPSHVVEELLGRIRTEIGALELFLRQIDQLRQVLRAVVDDAQQP